MKKILFNNCLRNAVVKGRKTMTRRIVPDSLFEKWRQIEDHQYMTYEEMCLWFLLHSPFNVCEVVAIAQSYESIHDEMMISDDFGNSIYDPFRNAMVTGTAGWKNSMFVRAELMPHRIKFTGKKVEMLRDISDDDCLKEGIICRNDIINSQMEDVVLYTFEGSFVDHIWKAYKTPREAFAALIDKVSGKGTWNNNPLVFAYDFELVS